MIRIEENVSLKGLNTFGVDVTAAYFTEIHTEVQFQELLLHPIYHGSRHLILGGGSNILFTKHFDGLVIKAGVSGISTTKEYDHHVFVKAGSGDNWHQLVLHCLQHGWGGVENLSLIPGTVGAAPMQNIGAYGVEIKDVIENVTGLDMITGDIRVFNNADCLFNYRESVFKQELKEKYFISSITLRLTKGKHQLNVQYGAIQDVLRHQHIDHPTIIDVSKAVISIRQSKLPDPTVIGNAGSFFKNPAISEEAFTLLKKGYPTIPFYPVDNQNVKVPAGWLIEQSGWKGKKIGRIGVHPHQALVLVNYGGGSGDEILELAMKIQSSVKDKFGIALTTEVNVV